MNARHQECLVAIKLFLLQEVVVVKVGHRHRVVPFIANKLSECLIKTTWQINERIHSMSPIKSFHISLPSCYTMAPFSGQLSWQRILFDYVNASRSFFPIILRQRRFKFFFFPSMETKIINIIMILFQGFTSDTRKNFPRYKLQVARFNSCRWKSSLW